MTFAMEQVLFIACNSTKAFFSNSKNLYNVDQWRSLSIIIYIYIVPKCTANLLYSRCVQLYNSPSLFYCSLSHFLST